MNGEPPLKMKATRFLCITALVTNSKVTAGLELLYGWIIWTRMHRSTGNHFTAMISLWAQRRSTVFGMTWTSPLCLALNSKRCLCSQNILKKMEPQFYTEMSTMHMGLWCTKLPTRACLRGMITNAELSYSQEVSSLAVRSTELTGPGITKPPL